MPELRVNGEAETPDDVGPSPSLIYGVRGIERTFRTGGRDVRVLRGVDLDIRDGEFVAVRGPSGSGKSTLLHILGLLDRPSAGNISYRGRDLGGIGERQRTALRATEFGFIFQFYYLLPEFTALENVLMPARIAGRRARIARAGRRERASGLLERVGLGHRLEHRPDQLSGGERQRVAIARALMNEPRIVFCDEPTGNLDSRTAEGIHELLSELNETLGQTIVAVTHEPAMARVAHRVLHMRDGVVIEDPDGGVPGSSEPDQEEIAP